MKIEISSLNLTQLEKFIIENQEKKFRATQIYEWIHQKLAESFDDMTNISKDLQKKLNDAFYITKAKIIDKIVSDDDKTIKYLFNINGDNIIESVLMKHSYGNSACISTQAGCKMGCDFCASTANGFTRNLTPGEMLNQVYKIQKDSGERISSIVLMGSGEPLDNYDAVISFIKLINDKNGLNIGERHITLSTCGLVDKIYELSKLKLQITLAVSLHAPNDAIRTKIMPIAHKHSMEKLISSCKYYTETTKRRITFEYAIIDGLNDKPEHAKELAKRLKNLMCHINLISINETEGKDYKKSSNNKIDKFKQELEKNGIETTIRRKLGNDINASCGQLRNKKLCTDTRKFGTAVQEEN